jgi:hypothetical protein
MSKDIKNAPPRTQLYIRLLHRKNGLSVAEMRDAVNEAVLSEKIGERRGNSFTPHNAHSLGLLATTYGQAFIAFTDANSVTRYMFRSDKNAEVFDAFKKEQQAETSKVARALARETADKAERKAERKAAKQPIAPVQLVSAPPANVPAIAAKASRAPRKVADIADNATIQGANA